MLEPVSTLPFPRLPIYALTTLDFNPHALLTLGILPLMDPFPLAFLC